MGNSDVSIAAHSHPSGSKIVMNGDGTGARYRQTPSETDQNAAGRRVEYVFGRANNTVYMYNGNGVIATFPTKIFKK